MTRDLVVLAKHKHKSFKLNCTPSNKWRTEHLGILIPWCLWCFPLVFTYQSNAQGTLKDQRYKQRTFSFLPPKNLNSFLKKLRFVSKQLFTGNFFLSSISDLYSSYSTSPLHYHKNNIHWVFYKQRLVALLDGGGFSSIHLLFSVRHHL